MPRPLPALLAVLALALGATATAQAAPLSLVTVGRFAEPTYVTATPSDPSRLYVVERAGTIRVVQNGDARLFADLRGLVSDTEGERGLLSIALAPDFGTSRVFYAFYTAKADAAVTVARFHATGPDSASPTPEVLLSIPHDQQSNHNGGQLQVGPDGLLYVGTGDGGAGGDPSGNGQDVDLGAAPTVANGVNHDARLGKILRLNPAAPAGTPPEIYALGVRNPYRFSFDRATGDLLIGDVGQDAREEVDLLPRGTGPGTNLGWSRFEGTLNGTAPGFTPPVLEYGHDAHPYGAFSGCSITGGYVVRDPQVPELAGQYVFADYCGANLRAARLTATGSTEVRTLPLTAANVISFGEDACGRLLVARQDGLVQRLVSGGGSCVAAPAAGAAPVTAAPPGPAPPRAVVRVTRTARQRAVALRRVLVRLRCDTACAVRADGLVLVGRQKVGRRPVRRLTARKARLAAGARVRLAVRLPAATRRAAARARRRHHTVTVRVVVRVWGAGGVRGTTRVVRIRASG